MRRRQLSVCSVALVLFLILPLVTQAQELDRYRHVTWDTSFHIGAHAFGLARLAKDTLKFDVNYGYAYHSTFLELASTLRQDSTDVLGTNPSRDLRIAFFDQLRRAYYFWQADSIGFHTIHVPGRMGELHQFGDASPFRALDGYRYLAPDFQPFALRNLNEADTDFQDVIGSSVRAVRIPSSTTDSNHFVAGDQIDVSLHAWRAPTFAFYETSGLLGAYALPIDSAFMMRFALHLRFDGVDTMQAPDATELGYVLLYRRVYAMQDTGCKCSFYEPFDSLSITKGIYEALGSSGEGTFSYKDVGFWLDMRDTVDSNYVDAVTAVPYHARPGAWLGYPDADTACVSWCANTLLPLVRSTRPRAEQLGTIEGSDITFRFYTRRRAPLSFLRSRFSTHAFEALKSNQLDAWLRTEVDTLFTDAVLSQVVTPNMPRFGIFDEPWWPVLPANRILSHKMQSWLDDNIPSTEKRPLFHNPTANFDGFRAAMGDLDTSRLKTVHMMARQQYNIIRGITPVFTPTRTRWARGRSHGSGRPPRALGQMTRRPTFATMRSSTPSSPRYASIRSTFRK